ncbi:MAG TPA: TIGR01777 family oxidoreductase [Cyclobacteriaceae bacterium]
MHHTLKKIVIAGGSGFIGKLLADHLSRKWEVVVLSRTPKPTRGNIRTIGWNGRDPGDWINEIEGAYSLINLTGKNVNCRYTPQNKKEILDSRLLSTKVLGEAVKTLKSPPAVWIQMSSATIYRHAIDKPMDETFGEIGSDFSMNVCCDWERTFNELPLNGIRRVIMRTSIVMGKDGGALPPLRRLVRFGLGGCQGNGRQMVSWIHQQDIVGVVDWMLNGDASGVYNVTSPQPIENKKLMRHLRKAYGVFFGLPSPKWLLTFGATLIGTETELVLKSRWVIPKRLLQEGYRFRFPSVEGAIKDLVR